MASNPKRSVTWAPTLKACALSLNGSFLRYTTNSASQQQATVKFHGVFTSHWNSPACAPDKCVRGLLTGDSDDLVTPFMHAVIQTARHFVTLREL